MGPGLRSGPVGRGTCVSGSGELPGLSGKTRWYRGVFGEGMGVHGTRYGGYRTSVLTSLSLSFSSFYPSRSRVKFRKIFNT